MLGILAIPVFSMHLGFADAGNDAPTSTTRKAYDLMADGYGPGTNGPLQVVVDADGGKRPRHDPRTTSRPLWPTSQGWPRWTRRSPTEAGDLAIVTVTPTTSPQDARTSDLLAAPARRHHPRGGRRVRRAGVGHRLAPR